MSVLSKFRDINKKKYRKDYTGAAAIDSICRCHGGCKWCLSNRSYSVKKKEISMDEQLKWIDIIEEEYV